MRDCSGAFLTGDIASPALERLVIKPGTPLSELQRKLNHLAQEVFNARSKSKCTVSDTLCGRLTSI